MPDGRSLLFTLSTDEGYQVVTQSLESGERKVLIPGSDAHYLPTGHIVYIFENDLFAIPFSLDILEVTGSPVLMLEGILRAIGVPQYAVSESGSLVYIPTTTDTASPQRTLVWVDREGREEVLKTPPNDYINVQISPDGTQVAFQITVDGNEDIWIYDLARKTPTLLNRHEAVDSRPIWTQDGKHIIFSSEREERQSIFSIAASGTGRVEQIKSMPDA